jgi:putative colanic acid biosynthesis acetyltransferase WcaF
MIEINENRKMRKYSRKEIVLRLLWFLCAPCFRWSPRMCWGWRRGMLRVFGARVGKNTHIYPSVRIFAPWHFEIGADASIGFDALIYNLGAIVIGNQVTISQRAHLCAGSHDFRDGRMTLLKPPITIEDEVWVCADAFVGPGVILGARSVIAARAVVVKDVEAGVVVGGNPAKHIGDRD